MSHEITSEDRLAFAGAPAWHGLGTVLPDRPSVEDVRRLALPWDPVAVPLFRKDPDPSYPNLGLRRIDHRAVVRSDSGAVLGIVGPAYTVVSNGDLARLAIAAGGEDRAVESAGSLRGGRDVFFLVALGTFDAAPGDPVHQYGLVTASHDGTGSLVVGGTDVRVVCANTRTAALRGIVGGRFRHVGNGRDLLESAESAARALREGDEQRVARQAFARALAVRPVTSAELRELFAAVYQRVAESRAAAILDREDYRTAGRKERARHDRAVEHRTATLARWIDRFEREGDRVPSVSGTAWAAVQAATEDVEHGEFHGRTRDRTTSRLVGTIARNVRHVYDAAAPLVGGAA